VVYRALALALAASVLLIVAGLVWNLKLRQRVAELSEPRADLSLASLAPKVRAQSEPKRR
jgi:hypothetical protein